MKVYLDTNCVIYLLEKNATWTPKMVARLTRFRAGGDKLAISDLTRAECLVGPFMSGNAAVEATYRAFFADPDIEVLPLTNPVYERAARIRATFQLELIDSLHLATAIEHSCDLFLTADARLARCTDITVEVLK